MALKPNKFKGGVLVEDNNSLELAESSASGTATVALKAPASLASSYSLELPASDGSTGQVLATNGSGALSFATQNATAVINSYTADQTLTSANEVVLVDASASAITITLPAVASSSGQLFTIKKTDSTTNDVIIDGNASEEIAGATTKVLQIQDHIVTLLCNGTEWIILNEESPRSLIVHRFMPTNLSVPHNVAPVLLYFSTSVVDTNNAYVEGVSYNTGTGTWGTDPGVVVQEDGYYYVSAYINPTASSDPQLYAVVNGTIAAVLSRPGGGAVSGSAVIPADKGDKISIGVFQNSGSSQNMGGANSHFSISKVARK